jgi:hypothetical protein
MSQQPIAGKAALTHSAGYALFESQEPLPPYELDPAFDSLAVRKRIGEVIAKAMGKRIPKREDRPRRNRVGKE